MCRSSCRVIVVALNVLVFTTGLQAQSDNWKKAFEQELEETVYQKRKVATFELNNITSPGTVFIVQTEGIVADRAHAFGTFVTKIDAGQPHAPGGLGGLLSRSSSSTLKKGERVYLYDVAIKDDAVLLNLLTCDSTT